jgi:DNA-directed RNA polymerase subunit F
LTAKHTKRPVPISEVKAIMAKVNKERDTILYEQRIAYEHAQKFAHLSVKKTNELLKKLIALDFIEEDHAYKIADLLPLTDEDIKTIFAKERTSLSDEERKKILEIVGTFYTE